MDQEMPKTKAEYVGPGQGENARGKEEAIECRKRASAGRRQGVRKGSFEHYSVACLAASGMRRLSHLAAVTLASRSSPTWCMEGAELARIACGVTANYGRPHFGNDQVRMNNTALVWLCLRSAEVFT